MPDNPITEVVEEEIVEAAEVFPAGWHVTTKKGEFLGCYHTEEDARSFAEQHLEPQGVKYSISEVV